MDPDKTAPTGAVLFVDPDKTAPTGAVLSVSTLFVDEASNILVDDIL